MRRRPDLSFDSLYRGKIPFVTLGIIALNLLGMLYEISVGIEAATGLYGMREGALQDGEWARMIGNGFLHFSIYHFASNMACLFFFGMSFEKKVGPLKYVIIYIVALIGAGLTVNFFGGEHAIHAGASGGIWGLMGAALVVTLKDHRNPMYIGRGIIFNLIYSFSAGVSWQGHIGGGIAGFLAAAVLLLAGRKKDNDSGNDDFIIVR